MYHVDDTSIVKPNCHILFLNAFLHEYIHVRLAKAPVAWYALHPLEDQQRDKRPIRSDNKELATAHDINPCTALNQSTNQK